MKSREKPTATPIERHRETEQRLQALARMIDAALPAGVAFALVTFTVGDAGYAGYVSSGNRTDMIKALRECADVIEAKADLPRGAPMGRA